MCACVLVATCNCKAGMSCWYHRLHTGQSRWTTASRWRQTCGSVKVQWPNTSDWVRSTIVFLPISCSRCARCASTGLNSAACVSLCFSTPVCVRRHIIIIYISHMAVVLCLPVSEMTYTVSSGTLNPSIPYLYFVYSLQCSDSAGWVAGRASSLLVRWWWWSDWSLARLVVPVVTVTSIILRSNKIQNGDSLLLAYPGWPGK